MLIDMDTAFLKGKSVLIMGLGHFGGGVDVTKFAYKAGARVIITDLASAEQLSDSVKQLEELPGIEFHLGSHEPADFEQAGIVVANPAIAPANNFLQFAREHNKFITSQINIFFELCPASIIGVTGTNGKSTTAALVAHLLRAGLGREGCRYSNVWLSGNIGNEPLLETIDEIGADDLVVLELSSFQLEQLAQIQKAPKVALLTNLTPNHLDRHGTFADYCAAKENIFKFQELDRNQPAISIFNADDKVAVEWFEKYKNDNGRICIKFSTDEISDEIRSGFRLPGRANLSNLAAAVSIAGYFGVDDEQIKARLPEFKALPHRLELVAEINGVCWYNDSVATTPESAICALEAFEQPKIIIAGGYDKRLRFDELGEKIAQDAKAAILIGQTARQIADVIAKPLATEVTEKKIKIEIVDSLAEAVELASRLALSGDVVLLSPACASYDMFDNFQHRGREFCRLVREIAG